MRPAVFGRAAFCIALAGLGAGAAPAQPPGPAAIPAELRPYAPSNLRSYFVGFLMGSGQLRPMSRELFIRHEAYIRRQFEAGIYHLAGPLADGGPIRGIVVLSAPTSDAALAILSTDPIVQEGGFTVEVHPAMFPDLSAVRVEYPAAN